MSGANVDDKKLQRLRRLLVLFFLALLVPTGALLLFAAEQMKWETYHQFREQAESLTSRIDKEIVALTDDENLRRSADYQFLIIEEADSNAFRRSPLAELPTTLALPGLVGHFQIEADGRLTSPLLPAAGISGEKYGVGSLELEKRLAITNQLRDILSSGNLAVKTTRDKHLAEPPLKGVNMEKEALPEIAQQNQQDRETVIHQAESGQKLKKEAIPQFDSQSGDSYRQNSRRIGSVADLRLDDSLEQRAMGREETKASQKSTSLSAPRLPSVQGRRKEQTNVYDFSKVLPRAESYSEQSSSLEAVTEADHAGASTAPILGSPQASIAKSVANARSGVASTQNSPLRSLAKVDNAATTFITSFESEVDPLKLVVFDEEHLVLYRHVWRNKERIVQGAVLDREIFTDTLIRQAFLATPLAQMSQLLIAYKDDVLNIYGQAKNRRYATSTESLTGSVLYRRSLAEPFNHFSLIFNIDDLPLGAGIKYLVWVAAALLCILVGGCYFMYKFGKGQISLYRQQQDFVSAVSHELKTPLTSIRMYSEMLKNSWASEDKKPGYYEYIHSESERLSRLIENVLQLARINRHQSDLKIETTNLGELMANASSKLGSLIEASDFTLQEQFDVKALESSIDCSQDATLQILINFMDNAIKFSRTAEIQKVIVRLDKLTNGTIEIGVRDFGPGIDQTQMKKIFELFYRSENELTRETVGTGIGLALAHQLATAMNARIDARNCQPGVEFTLTWPASAVQNSEVMS